MGDRPNTHGDIFTFTPLKILSYPRTTNLREFILKNQIFTGAIPASIHTDHKGKWMVGIQKPGRNLRPLTS